MARGALLFSTVAALLLLLPRAARADDGCHKDFGFGSVEGFATMQNIQNLAINGPNTPGRLVGLPAPSGGQLMLGLGANAQFRCDWLMVDILNVRMATGLGAGLGSTTNADGGPVSIGQGPLSTIEVGLPWFLPNGFQLFPTYNWKVAFKLEYGIEHQWANDTITGASNRGATASVDDWDWYFRMQLNGCRRLSRTGDASTRWGCLAVAPIVYEKAWFPGISLGFKVDL